MGFFEYFSTAFTVHADTSATGQDEQETGSSSGNPVHGVIDLDRKTQKGSAHDHMLPPSDEQTSDMPGPAKTLMKETEISAADDEAEEEDSEGKEVEEQDVEEPEDVRLRFVARMGALD